MTSAFVQRGKAKPLNILIKFAEYAAAFWRNGLKATLSNDVIRQLEKFVCHLYGRLHIQALRSSGIILFGIDIWCKDRVCVNL